MSKDYSALSKDELISLVERLEDKRKYGLVWDEEHLPEKVVLDCRSNLPILKPFKVKNVPLADGEVDHVLIRGDNFHALSVLSFTHRNAIDLIYIDPPYNTGNEEDEEGFVYNDKRVDSDDTYRHSKWLNFLSRRLDLAKDLLTDSGLIFISIDEHEFAQLRLLCDQTFGESNFINFITWKKRSAGGQVKDGSIIAQTEFVFIYAKNKKLAKVNKIENPNVGLEKWRDLRKSGGQWQRRYRPKQYFPFFYDVASNELFLERTKPSQIEIFPLDSKGEEGFWENGVETATSRLKAGEFKAELIKSGALKGQYKIKQLEVAGAEQNVGNFVDVPSVQGANEIREMGLKFNNAKPLNLLEFILKIGSKKDALVLDFFAGSGTTGHAVLRLNRDEGASRRAILCTNNEINVMAPNGICMDVTIPRLFSASNGYKNDKGVEVSGLGGNWRLFTTEFISNDSNKDQVKFDITAECDEMLAIKENAFETIAKNEKWSILGSTNKSVGIYQIPDVSDLPDFRTALEATNAKKKVAYIFCLDQNGLDMNEFADWQGIEIKEIPQKIIDIYKRIFKL